jgi:hypothetical protein
VSTHFVLFDKHSALKARTSRKVGSKEFKMATTHYLDLPSLERWLREWKDALLSEAGVSKVTASDPSLSCGAVACRI